MCVTTASEIIRRANAEDAKFREAHERLQKILVAVAWEIYAQAVKETPEGRR